MKKLIFILWGTIVLMSFTNGIADKDRTKGELICEQKNIDVGRIVNDTIFKTAFRFKNNGSEELRITQFNVSCNCTQASVSDSLILPNEECEFFMEVDTKGKSVGKHKVTAVLQTNGQRRFYKLTSLFEIRE
jgi:archaellum component FlaF (FlaF/FlaG flagellin family)